MNDKGGASRWSRSGLGRWGEGRMVKEGISTSFADNHTSSHQFTTEQLTKKHVESISRCGIVDQICAFDASMVAFDASIVAGR